MNMSSCICVCMFAHSVGLCAGGYGECALHIRVCEDVCGEC